MLTSENVQVGDSLEKLEKTFKNTGNAIEGRHYYSVWYIDNELQPDTFYGVDDKPENTITYYYYFDENNNNIDNIVIGSVDVRQEIDPRN